MAAPPAISQGHWRSLALIGVVALVVMLPELVAGPSFTFSFRYNFVWAGEFSRLFLGGNLWPRWLPALWDGLGSPSFYFYPPLFFWVVSLVRAISFGWLPATTATTIATLLILAASGGAMRAWLKGFASEGTACAGAIGYMLAPYHLDDIYSRGALAEVTVYALLPLIMITLRNLATRERAGDIALLAIAYGALILSHLPAALLASATLLPVMILWQAWHGGGIRHLLRSAIAIAIGTGLAACYWLPALALRPYTSWYAMGGDFYRIDRWFFFSSDWWQVAFPALLTLAAMLFALAAMQKWRDGDTGLWIALILLCGLMISGVLPFVWKLPGLREVQFAWRLLVVVEFAAITLLVKARPPLTQLPMLLGVTALASAAGLMLFSAASRIESGWRFGDTARAAARTDMAEAPEYLPAGYPIGNDKWGRADPGQFVAPAVPLTQVIGRGTTRAKGGDGEDMIVTAQLPAAARIVVRRFSFPGWIASRGNADQSTVPYGRDRLVSWIAPAGVSQFHLHRVRPAAERTGMMISAAAAALLVLLILTGWRNAGFFGVAGKGA